MEETKNQNDYTALLDEAYEKIKPVESKIDRFEVPKVEGHVEGTKTIITNFKQICDYIRRDCSHILKHLLKDLASPGAVRNDRLILSRVISSKLINEKIQKYVDEFVICRECKKPDTEFMKQDRVLFMHCLACGAKHSLGTGV